MGEQVESKTAEHDSARFASDTVSFITSGLLAMLGAAIVERGVDISSPETVFTGSVMTITFAANAIYLGKKVLSPFFQDNPE